MPIIQQSNKIDRFRQPDSFVFDAKVSLFKAHGNKYDQYQRVYAASFTTTYRSNMSVKKWHYLCLI